ncbi:MAG: hypothetical protein U0517_03595 [Candidatus Andersenbacteria bacterium]
MDPATPVRNLIEEPTVETGILALPGLHFPGITRPNLTVSTWLVTLVLLLVLVGSSLVYYCGWPWHRKKASELTLIDAIDQDPKLRPRS